MVNDEGLSSVSSWIADLRHRDPEAQRKIWQRFVDRLVRYARRRLAGSECRVSDAEDIAILAFENFFRKTPDEFEKLVDRNDLWQILAVLADRRAIDQIRKESSERHGGGRLVDESMIGDGDSESKNGMDNLAASSNFPDYEVILIEEVETRLDSLPTPTLRRVALEKMRGARNREIADRLDLSLRSVERKLSEIRDIFRSAVE